MKYKKNEAFVDVVETVNLIMSAKGPSVIHFPYDYNADPQANRDGAAC